jgi:galactose mutarotase-like enzyme
MSVTVRNGRWRAVIAELGAELRSLVDITTGQEYMWQANPAWWNGTAPVLFPVIGGLKNGAYTWEGREYKLDSHGFARASEFSVISSSVDSVELELTSSATTRESYPFEFRLRVGFQLERAGIAVSYEVKNTGRSRMCFSIGSHPAFNLPFAGGSLENYYVLFEREESLERWFFKDGLVVAEKTAAVMESSRVLTISRTLFDQGVLIFKSPQSHEFTIAHSMGPRSIKVVTDGVPYLGVWSKPNGAPFVCIEPWHGLPDSTNASGDLAEKEGIISLDPAGAFTTGYRVEIT